MNHDEPPPTMLSERDMEELRLDTQLRHLENRALEFRLLVECLRFCLSNPASTHESKVRAALGTLAEFEGTR